MDTFKYRWAAKGDLNAFFALLLDNMLNLVMLAAILGTFGFPLEFALKFMIPGTALGVLFGDAVYSWMAVRLAKKTGNPEVTAMPLGLDTPSTIGITLVVLGPVWLETKDAFLTWQVGMATMVLMGVVKLVFSFLGDWIRRKVPDAGLIGSLGGVGLALLAFLPLFYIFSAPVVGLIAFGLVVYSLIARGRLPFGIPGAFAAVLIGTVLWHLLGKMDMLGVEYRPALFAFSKGYPIPTLEFIHGFGKALEFLPVAIPFGLLTIIGGINVTESARLAGDNYKTRDILLTEAVATLLAGVCGGVSQSTPYIGHPAYKKMGARAAYTLATGLFIGIGGCFGLIQFIVDIIPAAAVTPILVFIGIEILSQAYLDCPREHSAAVGLALLPCIAELIRIVVTGQLHITNDLLLTLPAAVQGEAVSIFNLIGILGRGFIITAMMWGAATAHLISKESGKAAFYFLLCAVFTSFGLIHSTAASGGIYLPWQAPESMTYYIAAGYLSLSVLIFMLAGQDKKPSKPCR